MGVLRYEQFGVHIWKNEQNHSIFGQIFFEENNHFIDSILSSGKNIYFASDVHLGAPLIKDHREHEKRFVAWLDYVKDSAEAIYLLGDIFDFWFEYKKVVPRGNTRLLGKLAELTDSGIPVHFFTGNHDIWVFDYLPAETGVIVHRHPVEIQLNNKLFYLAHGDGLGGYDKKYNLLKILFTNKMAQWFFAHIHPNWGIAFASLWSKKSREKNLVKYGSTYLGEDKEWLVLYSKLVLKKKHFDYFIFGHRHVDRIVPISNNSTMVYLGDWIKLFSYGVWDGNDFKLEYFQNNKTN